LGGKILVHEDDELQKIQDGLACPECGQFLGPMNICPYCRTKVKGRVDIKIIKAVSILVAILGVGLLLLWANLQEPSGMKIGDISKRQNYAFVEIEGEITGDSMYYVEVSDEGEVFPSGLSFWLDDGTGVIKVKTYDEVTKDIIEAKKIPVEGDRVVIKGNVMFREDDMSMTLQSPDNIEIVKDTESPKSMMIQDISGKDETEDFNGKFDEMDVKSSTISGSLTGIDSQTTSYRDLYDNLYFEVKDTQGYSILIKVPYAIYSAYGGSIDEGVKSLPLNQEDIGDEDIKATGHLVWDRYNNPTGGYGGSWVLVLQDITNIKLEV